MQMQNNLPLCFDLDGTLIRTDLFHESLVQFLKINLPVNLLKTIYFVFIYSRPKVKSILANATEIDIDNIPVREDLLSLCKDCFILGRPVYLVTGANIKLANLFAQRYPYFSGVYASTDEYNLTGEKKANLLLKKFGFQNFDYVGDSTKDLFVWESAKISYVVEKKPYLVKKITGQSIAYQVNDSIIWLIRHYIRQFFVSTT